LRAVRRYPEVVVVSVRDGDVREGSPAVVRAVEARVEDVDRVCVLRVSVNLRVVPGALSKVARLVRLRPSAPAVVRAEDSALLRLDDCPDPFRVRGRDRDADLADGAARESRVARDVSPGGGAVGS